MIELVWYPNGVKNAELAAKISQISELPPKYS